MEKIVRALKRMTYRFLGEKGKKAQRVVNACSGGVLENLTSFAGTFWNVAVRKGLKAESWQVEGGKGGMYASAFGSAYTGHGYL